MDKKTKIRCKARSTDKGNFNKSFTCEENRQKQEAFDETLAYISNSDFENYSLDELVRLAKKQPEALLEFHTRIAPALVKFTNAVCNQNHYLDFSECYIHFKKTASKAIEIYDPKFQKPYIHLLRAMLKLETKNLEKKEAIRYTRERDFWGQRVSSDQVYLFDAKSDYEKEIEDILLSADIEAFIKTLMPRQQELFLMYYHQMTLQEIGRTLNIPTSTVAYWLKKILSLAKRFFESVR